MQRSIWSKIPIVNQQKRKYRIQGFKWFKSFLEYSDDMDDINKYTEESNSNKKQKTLIIFDDMIADMLSNRKFNPIVTELFIRSRKLNISMVFITKR